MEKLLTPEELSGILGVKISTIYQWTHMGKIPFLKMGGKLLRFREEDIREWMNAKKAKAEKRFSGRAA